MRLWTIHPKYLDAKGLVALWREGLLAQAVLRGQTRGYRHHPQLVRFQCARDPVELIAQYLWGVAAEAARRGYHFDTARIARPRRRVVRREHEGQLRYEREHLLRKLTQRAPDRAAVLRRVPRPAQHPIFRVVPGGRAEWEVTTRRGGAGRLRPAARGRRGRAPDAPG